jgi:hypothetical protein
MGKNMFQNSPAKPASLLSLLFVASSIHGEDLPPMAQWIPADAPIMVEVSEPMALVSPLLNPEFGKSVTTALENGKANPKLQQFQAVVTVLEQQLGTDWRTGLRRLAGKRLSFCVGPSGATLLAADGEDEKLLSKLNDIIWQFASSGANQQDQPETADSRDYRGVKTWKIGTNEVHALLGPRLVLGNRMSFLHKVLDLRAEAGEKTLASSALFKAARDAVGKEAVASVFLNLQTLRETPGLKKALEEDGNPVTALLLADTKAALRSASWLALGVYVSGEKLILRTYTDGAAPESSKWTSFSTPPEAGGGLLPPLTVPGTIATLSLYRDLHSFYAAKNALFPERTSGLIFFENMMGIFFSGIDLTEGVLSEVRPDVRVVVAKQQYDPAIGTPATQVPAFAAVLRLKEPQHFGETVEEAWQKAIGLANFTRGQQALPGLIIDKASQDGIKYTISYYRPPADKSSGAVDTRYNFRPSLARPGDYVILSSTDALARDLIEVVKKAPSTPAKTSSAANSLMEIEGPALSAILEANREQMVRKNMVDKGDSREKAESDIQVLLATLGHLDHATLTLRRDAGRPQAQLEIRFK